MSTIVGIDLGTSTIEAAVYRDGKPCMLPDFKGNIIIPSAVGIDEEGNYVIGERAKAQFVLAPEKTAIEIKRKIGTGEVIKLGKTSHTPVELSARLLEHVRRYISDFQEEDITRAVISVPAYFDDIQRQETVEAGKKAGFTVERIINEPTAAALSYGIEHMEEESYILVYDFGGGTFDVTLLEMFRGVLEVKASSGDNRLGGKDFDERLIEWLVGAFKSEYGVDLKKDTYAMVKLKEEAERCKIALSTERSYAITIPFITQKSGAPLAMEKVVTVEQFEELIRDLIDKTHYPIDVVLADSQIDATQINQVLLVGGTTRVPAVQTDVGNYLGIKPSLSLNPDFAVAEGASIQAGIIEGSISAEDSLIITDVNPFTLGIRTFDGYDNDNMSILIPRNVTIPVMKKDIFSTSSQDQTVASIEVYQGESRDITYNHFLGEFKISGIPPKAPGEEKIEVEFRYNQNGMLAVSARIVSTGEKAAIEIDMMENALKEESRSDVSGWKEAIGAKAYRTIIRRAERSLKAIEGSRELAAEYRELDERLYLLKKAILESSEEAEELEQDIYDILDDIDM